jgi:hypothetical protein
MNTFSDETDDRTSEGTFQELSVGSGGSRIERSVTAKDGTIFQYLCPLGSSPTGEVACYSGQEAFLIA